MALPDSSSPEKNGPAETPDQLEGPPPVFKNWKAWYLLVLGNLIALVLFFYWLTQHFS